MLLLARANAPIRVSVCKKKCPLLKQGSRFLWPEIQKLTGKSQITKDTGWCSAVSSTMALAGERLAAPGNIQYHQELNYFPRKVIGTIDDITRAYAPTIFMVGQSSKTNWEGGGTNDSDRKKAYEKYFNAIKGNTSPKGFRDIVVDTRLRSADFINLFREKKPALSLTFIGYELNAYNGYRWTMSGSSHALALNGFEDGYLKIYDPWGRIYNVQLTESYAPDLYSVPIVEHVSGDYNGFVKTLSGDNKKVVLHRYIYLYSHSFSNK